MTEPTLKQPTCGCLSASARRCYEIRYPAPMDDFERSMFFEDQEILGTDECDCGCHEPDEYPDDYDDGSQVL